VLRTMQSIRLNSEEYTGSDISRKISDPDFGLLPNWEKQIFLFLEEWWNDKSHISQHTSGSTGTPKLIKLSKKAMEASAERTCRYFDLNKNKKAGLCLPVGYIAGKMMLVRAMICGLDLILLEPDGNPITSNDIDLDFIAMIPLQAENMLTQGVLSGNLPDIRTVLLGGAEVSQLLLVKIQKQSATAFFIGYGMTETCSHIALRRLDVSGSEYYSPLDGVQLSKDHRGCLLIKDTRVTDQLLTTNDVIEFDPDTPGNFRWLGRWDNRVNSGGIKFSPEELEQKIAHLIENRFLISSAPDAKLGRKLILVIEGSELNAPTSQDKSELLKLLSSSLPQYGVPKEVIYVHRLAMTPGKKIDRNYDYS
jgi:O-succinylbenzoic acid--CoA ligase